MKDIICTSFLAMPDFDACYRNPGTLPDPRELVDTSSRTRASIDDDQCGKGWAYPSLVNLRDPPIKRPRSTVLQLQPLQPFHGQEEMGEENCVHGGAPERDAKRAYTLKRHTTVCEWCEGVRRV